MKKTSRYTTLNGAANLLETDLYTIREYCRNGLFRTVGKDLNKRILLDDVEKLLVPGSVHQITMQTRRIKKESLALRDKVFSDYMAKVYGNPAGLHRSNLYAMRLIDIVCENAFLEEEDVAIVKECLYGVPSDIMAIKMNITPQVMCSRIKRAFSRISENLMDGVYAKSELIKYQRIVSKQREHIRALRGESVLAFDIDKDKMKLLGEPVESVVNLSVRARNCFQAEGIKTLGDLLKRTRSEILCIRNMGKTTVREIEEELGKLNIKLK